MVFMLYSSFAYVKLNYVLLSLVNYHVKIIEGYFLKSSFAMKHQLFYAPNAMEVQELCSTDV